MWWRVVWYEASDVLFYDQYGALDQYGASPSLKSVVKFQSRYRWCVGKMLFPRGLDSLRAILQVSYTTDELYYR